MTPVNCDHTVAIVALVLSGISIGVSIWATKRTLWATEKYGDLAGTKEHLDFERQEARDARVSALLALRAETGRITAVAKHNAMGGGGYMPAVARMPVTAFERAFLSSETSLLSGGQYVDGLEGCLSLVNEYLTQAYAINGLIGLYLGTIAALGPTEKDIAADALRQIAEKAGKLPDIMTQLQDRLTTAIAALA